MTTGIKQRFDATAVQNWLAQERSAERLQTGVLEIQRFGETVYSEVFGEVSPGGEKVACDTKYWIASMTKPIVSVAAMRLVEQGHLSLMDAVQTFVPSFGAKGVLTSSGELDPLHRDPTVLDLMLHTSGLTYGFSGTGPVHRQYKCDAVYDHRSTNAEMASRLARLPLMHQPGTTFEYGMSTDVLGYVIEVVTGLHLDDALEDLVLCPLGMKNTTFFPDRSRVAQIPDSPIRDSLMPIMAPEQTWYSGGAGLFSTVPDYLRFAHMLMEGGELLSAETLALMRQDHLPSNVAYGAYTEELGITAPWLKNGLGFGLGFAVRIVETPGLPGGVGEFFWPGVSGANFWVDPQNELIAVFMTHAPEHRGDHRIGLRDAIYAGLT